MLLSKWISRNLPLVRILFVFLLFMSAALWLPPELPLPGAGQEPVVKLTPPLLRLPELQINLLFSQKDNLYKDALEITKTDLLNYLRPNSELDLWEIQALQLQMIADAKTWTVISLSLPNKESMICILVPQKQQYVLFYVEEGLSPIKAIDTIPIPHLNQEDKQFYELLLITEIYSDDNNNITKEISSLWTWHNGKLVQVKND